jgi:hypothetical protein
VCLGLPAPSTNPATWGGREGHLWTVPLMVVRFVDTCYRQQPPLHHRQNNEGFAKRRVVRRDDNWARVGPLPVHDLGYEYCDGCDGCDGCDLRVVCVKRRINLCVSVVAVQHLRQTTDRVTCVRLWLGVWMCACVRACVRACMCAWPLQHRPPSCRKGGIRNSGSSTAFGVKSLQRNLPEVCSSWRFVKSIIPLVLRHNLQCQLVRE